MRKINNYYTGTIYIVVGLITTGQLETEGDTIDRGVDVDTSALSSAVVTRFITREVVFSEGTGDSPVAIIFDRELILATDETEIAHFTPVFSP